MAALIVGVTGIVGIPLAEHLLAQKWKVYGISRSKSDLLPKEVSHIALDVTNEEDCKQKLSQLTDVRYVFLVTWVNAPTEEERCVINKQLVCFYVFFEPYMVHCGHLKNPRK